MVHETNSTREAFGKLNVFRRGDRRAPHKPLLVLIALSEFQQGNKSISFNEIENRLKSLLNTFAPPIVSRHQPELPYWHLQSDGVWIVSDAESLPRQRGGFPKKAPLRETSGSFSSEVSASLLSNPELIDEIANDILWEHFPPSMHDDIIAQVGLVPTRSFELNDAPLTTDEVKRRDPAFRKSVLRAYEYRCAVTGFRAALGGVFFGCEAAHVKWHAYNGPDTISNGICMEPTIHKLFDAGAWTLTDDRRILVSKDFTGSKSAVGRLRGHHGQPLRSPLPGEPAVDIAYIRWHRDPELGGVFRLPGLDL